MAYRIARADGNFTAAATWGAVDATSLLDSQAGNTVLSTSFLASATFTPGAIEIDGIALKVASRVEVSSGTISVRLYKTTATAGVVAGTEVSLNVSDLPYSPISPSSAVQANPIGWVFFKFAAPVTLLAGSAYRVEASTSVASQVNLFRNATANNWSRMLRTTTTGAPAAGDSLFVVTEWSGPLTPTPHVVTMDSTAATDYGGGDQVLPSVGIGDGSTLAYQTTAATNYVLRVSGVVAVHVGGTLTMGTPGTPVPRSSTAVLEFDCASTGNFGLLVFGTATFHGESRTDEKDVTYALLTADLSATGTSLTVDTDTGWLDGDEIVVTPTGATKTEGEALTLDGDAPADTIPTTAGAAFGHLGSAADRIQAEVFLLTRNLHLRSTLSTAGAYCHVGQLGVLNADWLDLQYIFGSTTQKRGLENNGTVTLDYCVVRNSTTGNFIYSAGSLTTTHTHWWTQAGTACVVCAGGTLTMSDACICHDTTGSNQVGVQSAANAAATITLTRVFVSGTGADALQQGNPGAGIDTVWSLTDVRARTCGVGLNLAALGVRAVRMRGGALVHNTYGLELGPLPESVELDDVLLLGNITAGIQLAGAYPVWLRALNCVLAGTTWRNQALGVNIGTNYLSAEYTFLNCTFGVAAGNRIAHTTADLGTNTTLSAVEVKITCVNTMLASATPILAGLTSATKHRSLIAQQRAGQVTNTHSRLYPRLGTISYETATYRSAAPSEKLAPSSDDPLFRLTSAPKRVSVAAGKTVTVSAYVRKDGSYNGVAPRLICVANPALGIDRDVVMASLTVGIDTWEQLSGTTTPVAEENGVLEFYVDCTGTAGAVYVDDWSAAQN